MEVSIDPHHKKTIQDWLGTGSINIFGPQYAGKDTQGKLLAKLFDAAPLMGGGDILRNSVVPERVKQIMNEGKLIPIKDYIEIVLPYLSNPAFSGRPLILSAVGRWHGEEKGVLAATTQSDHPLKAVIYISLPESITWKRWKIQKQPRNGGVRQDETEQALEARLKEFREKTIPVIDFYRDMGILIEVDGGLPREEVFGEIIRQLAERADASAS